MPLICFVGIIGPIMGVGSICCACIDYLGSTTSWSTPSIEITKGMHEWPPLSRISYFVLNNEVHYGCVRRALIHV